MNYLFLRHTIIQLYIFFHLLILFLFFPGKKLVHSIPLIVPSFTPPRLNSEEEEEEGEGEDDSDDDDDKKP